MLTLFRGVCSPTDRLVAAAEAVAAKVGASVQVIRGRELEEKVGMGFLALFPLLWLSCAFQGQGSQCLGNSDSMMLTFC